MGNCRFKLSELIPNAWFYKLRYIGKPRKQKRQPSSTVSPSPTKKHQTVPTTTTTARSPRRSYYYSRPGVPSPSGTPRKSAGNRLRPRPNVSADPKHENSSAVCYRKKPQLDYATTSGDSSATVSGSFSPEFRTDQKLIPDESLDSSRHGPCRWATSKLLKGSAPTPPPVLDLHQIITKLANKPTNVRKTAGVRLKPRSPRISTMKSESRGGRSSGSAEASRRSRAVVKASVDPRREFKESMEEMIVENNITASKDLEELLACYLCLNSDEYHHIIINVFKQIWLDLNLPPP